MDALAKLENIAARFDAGGATISEISTARTLQEKVEAEVGSIFYYQLRGDSLLDT